MRKIKLTLHSDAGHSYLQVPKSVMRGLGKELCDAITFYSFQDDYDLYLEEDQDAPLVLEVMKKDWNVELFHIEHETAPCRKMRRVNC